MGLSLPRVKGLMRPPIGIIILALFAAGSAPSQANQRDLTVVGPARRALVIGNDAYERVSPLQNAVNDARDLAAKLEQLGFETIVATDVDLRRMEQAIDGFMKSVQPGDVALFHFSGHGMQADQENYLIPTDFELRDRASLRYDAYSASQLQDRLNEAGAQLSLVFLDACRNNGFGGARSAGGLAPMNPAHGSFIAFATGPGKTADDNPDGRNGLFTGILLETLDQPGLELTDIFRNVRERVSTQSEGRQVPWTISSVLGRFYFDSSAPAAEPGADSASVELAYWSSITDSDDPRVFESYLKRYPKGEFAELARMRAEALQGEPPPTPGTVRLNPADGQEYIWIPPGRFTQGCVEGDSSCKDDELPRRQVELSRGFWMAKSETTVARYKAFAKAHNKKMPPFPGYIPPLLPLLPPIAPGFNMGWKLTDHPITNVSWEDAKAYCEQAAAGRLPTEAEWEYAARGGQKSQPFPWGPSISRDKANYGAETGGAPAVEGADKWIGTAPVGSFPLNGYGLYDMAGNLWEWTADWYAADAYASGASTDPTGPASGEEKVMRGGAWDNPARALRSSDRNHFPPASVVPWVGVRCVVEELSSE